MTDRARVRLARRPTWYRWLHAFLGGYYWLPCKMCGRNYGGGEETGSLLIDPGQGYSVCYRCQEQADEHNKSILNDPALMGRYYGHGE